MTTMTATNVKKHTYAVGDDVSYGFNGDWYHDGKVAKITAKFLTTESGNKYSLKTFEIREYDEETNYYVDNLKEYFVSVGGGTWTLVKGIVNKQNPHF
jgi:hypothetical protein